MEKAKKIVLGAIIASLIILAIGLSAGLAQQKKLNDWSGWIPTTSLVEPKIHGLGYCYKLNDASRTAPARIEYRWDDKLQKYVICWEGWYDTDLHPTSPF